MPDDDGTLTVRVETDDAARIGSGMGKRWDWDFERSQIVLVLRLFELGTLAQDLARKYGPKEGNVSVQPMTTLMIRHIPCRCASDEVTRISTYPPSPLAQIITCHL